MTKDAQGLPSQDTSAEVSTGQQLLSAVAVIAIAAVLVGGGLVAAQASVEDQPEQPQGDGGPITEVPLSPEVSIIPLEGWQLVGEFDNPYPGVRISNGAGTLDAFATPTAASGLDLLNSYMTNTLQAPATAFQRGGTFPVNLQPSGLTGLRTSYLATYQGHPTPLEGTVTVVITASGTGVILDGWTAQGQYGFVSGEIDTMIGNLQVG